MRATAASGSSSSSKAVLHMRLFLFDPRLGGGAPRPRWGVPLVQPLFHTHFPRPAIVSFLPLPILAINGIFAISIDLHMTLLFVHVLPRQKRSLAWLDSRWVSNAAFSALFKQTLQRPKTIIQSVFYRMKMTKFTGPTQDTIFSIKIHSSVQFQGCSLCLFSLFKIILHQQVGNGDQKGHLVHRFDQS